MVSAHRIKTNKLLITELDMWDEFTTKALNNQNKKYYKIIDELIDKELKETEKWLDSKEAKKLFNKEIDYRHNLFEALEDVTLDTIWDAQQNTEEFIQDIYNKGRAKGFIDVEQKVKFTAQDKKAIELLKQYNFYLIKDVAGNIIYNIKNAIFQGVVAGNSIYEVADKIRDSGIEPLPGSTLSPLQRATMIARTETARIKNMATLQTYANVGLEFCKILTAEDDNVCYICLRNAYEFNEDQRIIYANHGDEKIHNLESVQPCIPAHPNCRCAVIPYIAPGQVLSPVAKPKQINLIKDARMPYIRDKHNQPKPIVGNNKPCQDNFLKKYNVMNSNPPQEAIEFFKIYTGKGDSFINGYLRGILSYEKAKTGWDDENNYLGFNVDFERALELKDIVFEKYAIPLERDIVACRRENDRYLKENDEGYYEDKGFLSTSINEYAKREIYGEELNYIIIPKGTPIIYLEGITETGKDYEILWPPGTRLKHTDNLGNHKKVWEI